MKKIILISTILFLLSGCTINYNISLEDNQIKEKITSKINYKKLDSDELSSLQGLEEWGIYSFKGDTITMHDTSVTYKGKKANINIEYDYDTDNFINAYLPNTCFDNYIYLNEEDYYYIELSGKFGCMYADETNITITTNNIVEDTNAKVKNNKYIWTINNSNKDNTNIYIKISKEQNKSTSGILKGFKTFSMIALIILIIKVALLYKIIKNK